MTTQHIYNHIPALRFPDFLNDGEWDVKRLGEIAEVKTGFPFDSSDFSDDGNFLVITNGNIQDHSEKVIDNIGNRINVTDNKILNQYLLNLDDILVTMDGTVGRCAKVRSENLILAQRVARIIAKDVDKEFLYQFLRVGGFSKRMAFLAHGGTIKHISLKEISDFQVCLPPLAEQRRIAACLSALDEMLAATNGKLEQLKAYKKGLMQKLFPAKGKKLPELRFKEFEKDGEWEEKKYEDCLDYEQPQSYLVSSENYKKTGVPVLTAGKTFILGFTDETFGVYTKLPVIIFDDFTTDSRFVDFPFKAKSSAMKMLSVKEGYDLRFIFATMQNNEFKPHDHQRHWISIYSRFKVEIPSLAEQRKIAGCLTSIDDMINQYTNKVSSLELYKKGLMQQLFPTSK